VTTRDNSANSLKFGSGQSLSDAQSADKDVKRQIQVDEKIRPTLRSSFLKINPIRPGATSGVQPTQSGHPAQQPGAGASSTADKVDITSLSSQLHALESSLADVGVVDAARVDAIKQAISEGRFKIDSDVVADKLLTSVKELLLNHKQAQ
jgi:negative regulator of flagellin synthesis FlgM